MEKSQNEYIRDVSPDRSAFLVLCLILFCGACTPASPIRVPVKNGQSATSDIEIRKYDCKSNSGIPLEFCVNGVAVKCENTANGEYCSQVTSDLVGRMWGPF
ncbi:hypothetical protein EBR21_11605 [bacterium]|nr:hypothetical protein [bacterium]